MEYFISKSALFIGVFLKHFLQSKQNVDHHSKANAIQRAGLVVLFLLAVAPYAYGGSASLSWNANTEPDLAGYKVYVGKSAGTYDTSMNVGNTTSHTVTGLADGTYFFAVTASDTSGNESGFSNEVSKAISTVDTSPPVISGIGHGTPTETGATVSWTTDEASDTQVEYGTTTAYGSITTLDAAMVTNHGQSLTGLSSGTTYHYRVLSRDVSGNLGISADNTFTTATGADLTPPAISAISAGGISN
ncbi:MAG: fibronectin type III domain-containing protein, partial [Nitrospiria bacterium]